MTLAEAIDAINEDKFVLVHQIGWNKIPQLFIVGKNNYGGLIELKTKACSSCGRIDKRIDLHYLESMDRTHPRTYELITTGEYNTLINKYFK